MNMVTEEIILSFFQLPKETEDELRAQAKLADIEWIVFLNELYDQFNL